MERKLERLSVSCYCSNILLARLGRGVHTFNFHFHPPMHGEQINKYEAGWLQDDLKRIRPEIKDLYEHLKRTTDYFPNRKEALDLVERLLRLVPPYSQEFEQEDDRKRSKARDEAITNAEGLLRGDFPPYTH